jgi:hypothetical protein
LTETLAELAECSRRNARPAAPRLIAVTKSVGAEQALELYRAGQRDFGENRLPDLEQKCAAFAAAGALDARWHFLGHLQRNKARRVVKLCHAIHSVDSLALIDTLERIAKEEGRRPALFVELALSGESEKTGLPLELLPQALAALKGCSHLEVLGLMCMAPLVSEPVLARQAASQTFAHLAAIAAGVVGPPFVGPAGRPQLSMGMSSDWREALAAGSDWVRIGTALFAAEANAARPTEQIPPKAGGPGDRGPESQSPAGGLAPLAPIAQVAPVVAPRQPPQRPGGAP